MKIVRETKDTSTIKLKVDTHFDWELSQFIMVQAEIGDKSVRRAYTISSSPTRADQYLEITVRQTDDPTMSKYLNEREEGEDLNIKGPYGRFIWNTGVSEKVICLGAGSGITPFRAFFEYFIDEKLLNPIKLLYTCSYGDNVIFKDELKELVSQIDNGEYKLSITRDPMGLENVRNGRINKEYLEEELKGWEGAYFYLCGAPGFVKALINTLIEIGIPKSNIKKEQWG